MSSNEIRLMLGHADWVVSVTFSPSGEFIASGKVLN